MVKIIFISAGAPSAQHSASSLSQLWNHIDTSQQISIDMTIGSINNALELVIVPLRYVGRSNLPIQIEEPPSRWKQILLIDGDRDQSWHIELP